ncbi:hypothetical protein L0B53_03255 [Vibrio sp. SS-MA-C1-2]|uniref:hypothetical protein n=1 Tax=Vibrio sp. SS-MA-C1-2 TaxID=2908646 RepID=UPI001F370013|nr:hypothetical protein [Vibrio sp. SS-MA-C1-2]UJF16972.1 hypothetical protein L0B53_03255 [Vibrio sp. SS-MA-C1-2]
MKVGISKLEQLRIQEQLLHDFELKYHIQLTGLDIDEFGQVESINDNGFINLCCLDCSRTKVVRPEVVTEALKSDENQLLSGLCR